jgi:hypothetical protein
MKKETKEKRRWKRLAIFMDWQNQYCENDYTSESKLQIHGNPHENSNVIFQRNRKFIWKQKRPQLAFLSKKSSTGGITILNFKL